MRIRLFQNCCLPNPQDWPGLRAVQGPKLADLADESTPAGPSSGPTRQSRLPKKANSFAEERGPQLISPVNRQRTVSDAGARLPLENAFGMRHSGPFFVGIAGGTASGKTSVTNAVHCRLEEIWGPGSVARFSQDCFYRDLTEEQLKHLPSYNFDHPDAFDFDELMRVIRQLQDGDCVMVPKYDYSSHRRRPQEEACLLNGANLRVVIIEGILLFYYREIRDLFDLRVFVDVASDTRLCRRIRRDILERKRDVGFVLQQYQSTVKPSFEAYCQPTKKYAHIIMPRGIENERGLQVLIDAIERNA